MAEAVNIDEIVSMGKHINKINQELKDIEVKFNDLLEGFKKEVSTQLTQEAAARKEALEAMDKSATEKQESHHKSVDEKISAFEVKCDAKIKELEEKVAEKWVSWEHSAKEFAGQLASELPAARAHTDSEVGKVASEFAAFRKEMDEREQRQQKSLADYSDALKAAQDVVEQRLAKELEVLSSKLNSASSELTSEFSRSISIAESRLNESLQKIQAEWQQELSKFGDKQQSATENAKSDADAHLRKVMEQIQGQLKDAMYARIGIEKELEHKVAEVKQHSETARQEVASLLKQGEAKLQNDFENLRNSLQQAVDTKISKLSEGLSTLDTSVLAQGKQMRDLTTSFTSTTQSLRDEDALSAKKISELRDSLEETIKRESANFATIVQSTEAQRKQDETKARQEQEKHTSRTVADLEGLRKALDANMDAARAERNLSDGETSLKLESFRQEIATLMRGFDDVANKLQVFHDDVERKLQHQDSKLQAVDIRMRPWRSRFYPSEQGLACSTEVVEATTTPGEAPNPFKLEPQVRSAGPQKVKRPGSSRRPGSAPFVRREEKANLEERRHDPMLGRAVTYREMVASFAEQTQLTQDQLQSHWQSLSHVELKSPGQSYSKNQRPEQQALPPTGQVNTPMRPDLTDRNPRDIFVALPP